MQIICLQGFNIFKLRSPKSIFVCGFNSSIVIEQQHTCLLFCTFLVASTPKPLQGPREVYFGIDLISKHKVPFQKAQNI